MTDLIHNGLGTPCEGSATGLVQIPSVKGKGGAASPVVLGQEKVKPQAQMAICLTPPDPFPGTRHV